MHSLYAQYHECLLILGCFLTQVYASTSRDSLLATVLDVLQNQV